MPPPSRPGPDSPRPTPPTVESITWRPLARGAVAPCDCARCGQPILIGDPASKPAERSLALRAGVWHWRLCRWCAAQIAAADVPIDRA